MKKYNLIMILLLCLSSLIIQGCGSTTTISDEAVQIIESDLDCSIDVNHIYYNEAEQGCVIEFSFKGVEETACVNLKNKTVGYETVYTIISLITFDPSLLSDEELQLYAKETLSYPYIPVWVYSTKDTDNENWNKLK